VRVGIASDEVDNRALSILGLRIDEEVRFQCAPSGRWRAGTVTRRQPDGTVALTDKQGRCRGIPVQQIEVRCTGPRGGRSWEPLVIRASRSEQLRLL
jgi:hypothetical protein